MIGTEYAFKQSTWVSTCLLCVVVNSGGKTIIFPSKGRTSSSQYIAVMIVVQTYIYVEDRCHLLPVRQLVIPLYLKLTNVVVLLKFHLYTINTSV